MPAFEQPEHFYLQNLLVVPSKITAVFRTGMVRQITFKTNQFPLSPDYKEIHKTALTRIPLLLHPDTDQCFIMVSVNQDSQVVRREYMVKRAIIDLKEQYNWEVSVC